MTVSTFRQIMATFTEPQERALRVIIMAERRQRTNAQPAQPIDVNGKLSPLGEAYDWALEKVP